MNKQKACEAIHNLGGCDAAEEWSKGYDAGITAANTDNNAELISRSELQSEIAKGVGECRIRAFEPSVNYILQIIHRLPSVNGQPVNQWISVNDRLPDENQKCLVYRDINADLKITTGIWHSDMKEFYGLRHGTRLEDTIAWMPLPEPPKDGDTNG